MNNMDENDCDMLHGYDFVNGKISLHWDAKKVLAFMISNNILNDIKTAETQSRAVTIVVQALKANDLAVSLDIIKTSVQMARK